MHASQGDQRSEKWPTIIAFFLDFDQFGIRTEEGRLRFLENQSPAHENGCQPEVHQQEAQGGLCKPVADHRCDECMLRSFSLCRGIFSMFQRCTRRRSWSGGWRGSLVLPGSSFPWWYPEMITCSSTPKLSLVIVQFVWKACRAKNTCRAGTPEPSLLLVDIHGGGAGEGNSGLCRTKLCSEDLWPC